MPAGEHRRRPAHCRFVPTVSTRFYCAPMRAVVNRGPRPMAQIANPVATLTRTRQQAQRVGEVVRVFTRYGFGAYVKQDAPRWMQRWFVEPDGRLVAEYTVGERLRMALTELGTTYIKLGQMLSTREDIVGSGDRSGVDQAAGRHAGRSARICARAHRGRVGRAGGGTLRRVRFRAPWLCLHRPGACGGATGRRTAWS